MYASRFNLILKLKSSTHPYAVLNPLSGSLDLATEGEASWLRDLAAGRPTAPPEGLVQHLLQRGYIYDSREEEESALAKAFSTFLEENRRSPTQVFVVPTYRCNLACTYCFQDDLPQGADVMEPEVAEALFAHLPKQFGPGEPLYLTLFGGEPLLDTPAQRRIIRQIAAACVASGYPLAVVTNGYALAGYLDLLINTGVRLQEIQVTLDGPPEVHDRRRRRRGGGGSFERVLEGAAQVVAAGIPLNLRMVVDRENLSSLLPLAELVEAMGWLELEPGRFKTQLGRNYRFNGCRGERGELFSRLELWAEVAGLAKSHPVLARFHRPDFHGLGRLLLTGELPIPNFDTCPACKKEWAFDLRGDIYGCTAAVGRPAYRVGTFYPREEFLAGPLSEWQERNVLAIEECRNCPVALICGGGCGVVAREQKGGIRAPDCRPVREILQVGLDFYGPQLLALSEGGALA